ncbi:MAG TPA: Calx-beta domain-containing protein [Chitinophagales bacterium]
MKKRLLLFIGTFLTTSVLFAQQLNNASVETWTNSLTPDYWDTSDSLWLGYDGTTPVGAETRNTNASYISNGTSSLKIQTVNAGGEVYAGVAVYGDLYVSGSSLAIQGRPFSNRPDSVRVALAFLPQGGDSLVFQVIFQNAGSVIGGVSLTYPSAINSLSYATLPISFQSSSTPDEVYVVATSGNYQTTVGSTLYIDNVQFIYNTPPSSTPSVSVAASPTTVSEGNSATFTATLSSPAASVLSVPAVFTGGTATLNTDFTVGANSFNFAAGATSATITMNALTDALTEGPEFAKVVLQTGTGYTLGSPSFATVNITDVPAGIPTVTLSVSPTTVPEGGAATFTATLSIPATSTLTVSANVGGTATLGQDYYVSGGTFTFSPGSTTATITGTAAFDGITEGSETVIVSLVSGSGYNVGSPSSATVTITDAAPPTVTLSASSTSIQEGGSSFVVATLSAPLGFNIGVDYIVGGTAGEFTDYTIQGLIGSFSFEAGTTTDTIEIIALTDDVTPEGNETAIFGLSSGSDYTVGSPSSTTITITDLPSGTPTVTLAASPLSVNEGNTVTFTATLSVAATGPISVNFNYDGTATLGSDYTSSVDQFVFSAGQSTATVTLTIINDGIAEGDETVFLRLQDGINYTYSNASSPQVTIIGTIPTVSVVVSPTTISENGTATFTATLSAPATAETTVEFYMDGTAEEQLDYVNNYSAFHFGVGATTATVTLQGLPDAIAEGSEVAVLNLSSPFEGNYALGWPSDATLVITDGASGIKETEVMNAIRLYPNPASSTVSVEIPTQVERQNIAIVDVTGKTIKTLNNISGTKSIALDGLASGNYVVTFTNATTNILTGSKHLQVVK